jgi:hypothetical protein
MEFNPDQYLQKQAQPTQQGFNPDAYLQGVSQPMQAGAENRYTGLERAAVFTTPIATSIGGALSGAKVGAALGSVVPGLGTAVGGFGGMIVGGALGAGGGRIIADTMESVFGGDERSAEEILRRSVKEGVLDAALTAATFGAFKVAKATGLTAVIKKGLKHASKPVVQRIRIPQVLNQIKVNERATKEAYKLKSKEILSSAKQIGEFKLHNSQQVQTKLTKEIGKAVDKLAPDASKVTEVAEAILSKKYDNILTNIDGAVDLAPIIKSLEELPTLRVLAEGTTPLSKLSGLVSKVNSNIVTGLSPADKALFEQGLKSGWNVDVLKRSIGAGTGAVADVNVAHKLKQSLDNIISTIYSGSDKVAVDSLAKPLSVVRSQLIDQIDNMTGGLYKPLSNDWLNLTLLKKQVNSKLGKIGAGRSKELRGGIYGTLDDFVKKAKTTGVDVMKEQEGRVGALLKEIEFLDAIGQKELATTMMGDLGELAAKAANLGQEKKLFANISKLVGDEVTEKNLKKLVKSDLIKGQQQQNLKQLLRTQSSAKKAMESRISDLGIRKEVLNEAALKLRSGNRIAPVIAIQATAYNLGQFIPALSAPLNTLASMYSIYKFAPEMSSLVLKGIKAIEGQTARIVMSKAQRDALGQFLKSISREVLFQVSE